MDAFTNTKANKLSLLNNPTNEVNPMKKTLVAVIALAIIAFGSVAAESVVSAAVPAVVQSAEKSADVESVLVFSQPAEKSEFVLAGIAVDATNWEALVKKLSSGGDKKVTSEKGDTQAVLAGIAVDATNWDALIRKLSSGTNKAQSEYSESENPVYS